MSFEARLYIQGVGVYVPNKEKPESKMLVLFPNQEKASERGIRDSKGNPVCRHHAVVQFDPRCFASAALEGLPNAWTTIDLSGMWLRFTAEPPLAPRLTVDGRVPGVPSMPEILRKQIPGSGAQPSPLDLSLDPRTRPDSGSVAELLRAGLFLDAGVLSPYAEFEGLYRFLDSSKKVSPNGANGHKRAPGSRPTPDDHKLSSVLKLELGRVESFTLHFQPFGTQAKHSFDLPLHPPSDSDGEPWDELEVWVRHFCDLDRPDPDGKTAEPGEEDVDFALNYMLLERLSDVLKALGNVLPVPSISSSWGRGGLIGSEARKCMGTQA